MTLSNSAYQSSAAANSSYQSLYSDERRDLHKLHVRKETFIFYPASSIPTADMAAAGFYYTGEGHIIRCFCCKLTITCLNAGDKPFSVHRSRAPNCPFVRKTVTQGGLSDPAEDTVDGNSESSLGLPSDVEGDGDGPTDDVLVTRGVTAEKDVVSRTGKPLKHAAPINKAKLKKENERLRSEITCHKCRQTRVQTLFLPCRHLIACEECANSMDDCITCGEKILGTVRTFLI